MCIINNCGLITFWVGVGDIRGLLTHQMLLEFFLLRILTLTVTVTPFVPHKQKYLPNAQVQ